MSVRLSVAAADAQADALARMLAGGTLEIHADDPPRPGDEPLRQALAIFKLQAPAFERSAGGVALLHKPPSVLVTDSGRARWFRFRNIFGNFVYDGDIDELGLQTVELPRNATLEIRSYKLAIKLEQE